MPPTTDSRQQAIYAVVAQIPYGKVASYGQVAQSAGLGRAARLVGQVLKKLPQDTQLPWHRVVAANGRLSLSPDTPAGAQQRERLSTEGVIIRQQGLDMRRYGWLTQPCSE